MVALIFFLSPFVPKEAAGRFEGYERSLPSTRCAPSGRTGLSLLFTLCTISFQAHALFEYDRAITHAQKGNWEQSKDMLTKVLVDNQNADVLYDTGVSSFKSGEFDKALSYFTKAAQSPTANKSLQEQAYFNAGNAHVKLKQLQDAIDSYDHALALNPSNEQAKHNKEVVKKMLEQQKKEDQKQQDQKKDKDKEQDNKENQENKDDQQKQDEQNNEQNKQQGENKQNQDKKDQQEQKQNKSDEKKEEDKQQQSKADTEKEKQEQQKKSDQEKKDAQKGQEEKS